MPAPFDPTLKTLTELAPADWLPLAGRRRRRVTLADSDVGTLVSGASDKLFHVHDDPEYLFHLDFETGHFHAELPLRLRLYNSVFAYRHRRAVLSVVVLLRPEADSPQWTGLLESSLPGEPALATLRYQVIRVWRLDPELLLAGGIGTLPLAPISNVTEGDARRVIRRMKERLSSAQTAAKARDLWAATYVLLGLRYSDAFARALFAEVFGMKESTTYQAIIREGRAEGRVEEARHMLFLQGEHKFGPASAAIRRAIEAISDVTQLEALGVRLLRAESWQDVLPETAPRRGRGRKTGNAS